MPLCIHCWSFVCPYVSVFAFDSWILRCLLFCFLLLQLLHWNHISLLLFCRLFVFLRVFEDSSASILRLECGGSSDSEYSACLFSLVCGVLKRTLLLEVGWSPTVDEGRASVFDVNILCGWKLRIGCYQYIRFWIVCRLFSVHGCWLKS